MANTNLQVFISAENKLQANAILQSLLDKKLVAGGLISNGPAKFWWKEKITAMNYYNISAFTFRKYKTSIIKEVKRISIEEVPMVWFIAFEGNTDLIKWMKEIL